MKKRFLLLTNIFLFLGSGSLFALGFEETALTILTNGTEYISDTYASESESKALKTGSNLPDPTLGGEYLFAPESEDNRWAAELTWDLEWPGVYRARGNQSESKINEQSLRLTAKRIEKLTEIKNLLLDYISCKKKLSLLEDLKTNNDSIYQLAEHQNKNGELTILDLNKVKLEYASIRGAEYALIDEKAGFERELSQIYGRDCTEILENLDCEYPSFLNISEDNILAQAVNANAVEVAKAATESAKKGLKVAKMESLPSISFGYKHAFEEDTHFNGALLGITIPLFSTRGKSAAAKAEIAAAEFNEEATKAQIESEIIQTWKRLNTLQKQIDEITPLLENTDYNKWLLKAYEGGVITVIDYLTERNYFTTAALELENLRLSAAKSQVELSRYLSY